LRLLGRSAFVSEVFLTPEEAKPHPPPILLDLTEDAVTSYDRNDFLKNVLGDVKRRLNELGRRRMKVRNGYHWILVHRRCESDCDARYAVLDLRWSVMNKSGSLGAIDGTSPTIVKDAGEISTSPKTT